MQQKRFSNIILFLVTMLTLQTNKICPSGPPPGQDFRVTLAQVATEVDALLTCCSSTFTTFAQDFSGTFTALAELSACSPIPLFQSSFTAAGGTLTLATTGASYCLTQNIIGNIIISGSDVTIDLNSFSLIGTIEIQGTAINATIKNGNVKPAAPVDATDAAHGAIVIASTVYDALIKNCYIICSNTTLLEVGGRDGIDNSGINTIIDSCVIQAGAGAPNLTAYVSNNGIGGTGTTVTPIAVATNTPLSPITVGNTPDTIAITPNGLYAYVVNQGDGTISVINTITNALASGFTNPIPVGSNPHGIAITPDGTQAYVTNTNDNTVSVIGLASNTVTDLITDPSFDIPIGIAITPNGLYAYVNNSGNGTVSVITIATNTVTDVVTVVGSPSFGIAATIDSQYVYVADASGNTVTPITVATNTAGTSITVGSNPQGIAMTPDGLYAYVTNNGDSPGDISVITIATNIVTNTISGFNGPWGIAITPDNQYAYVANNGDTTVTPVTISTSALGAPITVGSAPLMIAIASQASGNAIVQQGNKGRIINTIVAGGSNTTGTGGSGILVTASTNLNIIQECNATNGGGNGFTMLTTGTVNLLECIASYNTGNGFDMSGSTGKGTIENCRALQNIGCGFNDNTTSNYQYISCVSEGNDGSPAVPTGDSNYCWADLATTSTFIAPSGPGFAPFYQNARNTNGRFFGLSSWDNVTLQ